MKPIILCVMICMSVYTHPLVYMSATQSPIRTYEYMFGESTIHINQEVYNTLIDTYTTTDTEYVYCIHGTYEQGVYSITALSQPPIYHSSKEGMRYGGCDQEVLIGTIHSHPEGLCTLSEQDTITFITSQHNLIGIHCSETMFGFFTQDNIQYPQPITIR